VPASSSASAPERDTAVTTIPANRGSGSISNPAAVSPAEVASTPIAAPPRETPAVTTPDPEPPVTTVNKPRTSVTITGQMRDAARNPIANVVVVLISAQGAVLTSTTDTEGNYSFKVAPSEQGYRLIPSRDGFTFEPVDRVLIGATNDWKRMDFTGTHRPAP
jgi:hypothetical protein